jgi:methylenetetrahydrofolate reductase (NADPH)
MIAQFEVLPFGKAEEQAAQLPEHLTLTVTCSPAHGLDQTVETATRLAALGHRVTVHLAARMLRDRAHLDEVLAAMADGSVEGAFVIGGDATPPVGPYASAGEILPLVHEHARRPRQIGIAGYPEGHPLIDDATLAKALLEKSALADYVVTQLCFSADALLRWIHETRAARVSLPVVAGVPGIVDRKRLMEISLRVGVGPSLSFLRKQGGARALLGLSARSADSLYDALAPSVGNSNLNLAGFHFFTFNRLVETWKWERSKTQELN